VVGSRLEPSSVILSVYCKYFNVIIERSIRFWSLTLFNMNTTAKLLELRGGHQSENYKLRHSMAPSNAIPWWLHCFLTIRLELTWNSFIHIRSWGEQFKNILGTPKHPNTQTPKHPIRPFHIAFMAVQSWNIFDPFVLLAGLLQTWVICAYFKSSRLVTLIVND